MVRQALKEEEVKHGWMQKTKKVNDAEERKRELQQRPEQEE